MTPEDKEAALVRAAMRGDTGDIPAVLARMLATLAAIIAAELSERETAAASTPQSWGRLQQIADHFGVTRAAVAKWMPSLIQSGRVRVLTPPGGGWTLYNIADIERALVAPPPRHRIPSHHNISHEIP